MWRPTNHTPEAVARFRERREETGIGASSAMRSTSSTPPRPIRSSTRSRSRRCVRRSRLPRDRGGGRHLPCRLASRRRLRGRPRADRAGTPGAARADDRRPLAADGELGRNRRHDRPLDRRARRIHAALDHHPRLGICLDSCHWYASASTSPTRRARRRRRRPRRQIGLDRLRCLHVNDSKERSARTATATPRSGQG